MSRTLRPDLMLGLTGFTLGAAALLLLTGATPNPPPPHGDTDLLIQAAARSLATAHPISRS